MEKLLFQLGFEMVRQKGSHVFYRHPDGRTTLFQSILAETLQDRS
jgi:predicted RNA binding protein YcfA (HicA-like mRNA interferase family)